MWMIDSRWCQYLSAGLPKAAAVKAPARADNIAVISLSGPLSKEGWYGTSTTEFRRQVCEAVYDESCGGIMLAVDSPGGTVSGTQDAADAVAFAAKRKPVMAYIDDLGASAAYWIASQARSIMAGQMAEVGSIGTMAAVMDMSGMAEREGIKVHVISTGAHKGAFVPGAPVAEEHLAALQARVNELNDFFLAAVQKGRKMKMERVAESADGQVWLAAEAQKRGLIDHIGTMDDAISMLAREVRTERRAKAVTAELAAERLALAEREFTNN